MPIEQSEDVYHHIEAYSHNGRIGVLVELETIDDWTARTVEFRALAKDVALQVAATDPPGIEPIAGGRVIHLWPGLRDSGKNGELLLAQNFVKDTTISVAERIQATEKALSAPIRVLRFVRYSNDET